MATKQITISLQGKNELKGAFSSAVNDIKKLQQESKRASTQVKNDFSSLGKGIKINSSGIFNKIVSEGKSAVNSLKSAFSGLGGAIASIFAGVSLVDLVQSAGNAESKWNRIAVYTGATGQNLKNQKVEVRALADHYGVVNGELSAVYETNLRFFGDQQKSMKFAAGIAATSKTTGQDMVTIQNAIMSGELGRNRQLQRSVLTEAQRNKYLADGELTQEEIGQLLAENEAIVEGNPALIEDANSEWARMESSIASLKVSLGKALLPIVKSLVPIISQVADTFTQLNNASGGLLGIMTGIGLAAGAIAAPLGMAWPVLTSMASAASSAASSIWNYVSGLRTASTIKPATMPTGTTMPGGGTTVTPAATGMGTLTTLGVIGGGVAILGGIIVSFSVINEKIRQFMVANATLPGILGDVQRAGLNAYGGILQGILDLASGGSASFFAMQAGGTSTIQNIQAAWNGLTTGIMTGLNMVTGVVWSVGSSISGAFWSAAGSAGSAFWGIASSASSAFWSIVGAVSGAMSSAYSVAIGWANNIASGISSIISGARAAIGMGPGGPGGPMGPRGPGVNISQARGLNYEGYAGHQKNPFEALLYGGNCVDMSLGLIGIAGSGTLVSGTYRGSPHVWANIGGRDYDPARRALEGTWTPPARGPGGSGTIVIYGDVYGYKDFSKKVEGALNRIV